MSPAVQFHVGSSVRRWKGLLKDADRALVFSPFVTSQTAETVLCSEQPSRFDVHVVFDVRHFASGTSSLTTLRRLKDCGYNLFALDGLNATVILVPGRWASVGSQSLRSGSASREETTVIIEDRSLVANLERQLTKWLVRRRPITSELLEEMERAVQPIGRELRKTREKVSRLNATVLDRAWARSPFDQKLKSIRAGVERLPKSGGSGLLGQVQTVRTPSPRDFGTIYRKRSLVFPPGTDLRKLRASRRIRRLNPTYRYGLLHLDTGRFGWARVMKTRITFVAAGVILIGRFGRVQLGDRVWQVTFNAPRSRPELDRGNLRITLKRVTTKEEVRIQAWLTPEGWRFGEIARDGAQPSAAAQDHPEAHGYCHTDRFRDLLLQRLLTPFKFEENLEGDEAHEFFGPVGRRYKLQLAAINGLPLLLTEGW